MPDPALDAGSVAKRRLNDCGQVAAQRVVVASPGRPLPADTVELVRGSDRIAGTADFRLGLSRPRRRRLAEEADHQRAGRDRGNDQ